MRLVSILALLACVGCSTYESVPRTVPPADATKRHPLRPWRDVGATVGGKVSPDGKEEINCDLPGRFHQKNTGGIDGAGLCVYASARHAGRWQNDPGFAGLFDWMKSHPGGSYPEKFKRTLEQYCKEKGLTVPDYIQVEENDYDLLVAASRNGYMIGSTYSYSPTGRYNGQRISHMVSLAHVSPNWVAVLDNNYIGENKYEWLTPKEYMKTATGGRTLWAVILLVPQPPPCPKGNH
jgi:hypothetical protein